MDNFWYTNKVLLWASELGSARRLVPKEDCEMDTYVILGNYTQQGVEKIKESPDRIEAGRKAFEAVGGKIIGWYLLMGRYDFMLIVQAPNSQAVASVLLSYGAGGNGRTETLRAFSEAEFKDIVASL